ncbi:MAG: class I SAM-dependent methyltransferase [Spirochaetales bacterium]|uniref:Class I SAM-dependent methyltransferase n=1 Tax=Candidatus Thalassospirochaeta sargassi TaxID=3119039 RepID=A0AAJ1IFE0_9SPIO|nr:class I SAM-dependent methyltransferase [Spirochaetales bacterium]
MIAPQKMKDFSKYLKQNHSQLRPWASKNGIECYRIYNRNISGIPFTLDFYKNKLHASCFENEIEITDEDVDEILTIAGKTLYIKEDSIFYKYRKKLTDHDQYRKFSAEGKEFTVTENNLRFSVNLSDYLDTGLFLDHRDTRMMVMDNSTNANVLNLFAYTGSFSVYAAAGYARSTTTVDMSNTYLNWAEKNMKLNNFTSKNHRYIHADALSFIKEAKKAKRDKWDLIILDPPTFSNSRKMTGHFDIQKNHADLITDCAQLLSRKGTILFSTNYRKFNMDKKGLKNLIIRDISKETIPVDFQGSKIHRCWTISIR